MFMRWIDPHTRRSVALAIVVLSITGLVLADRSSVPAVGPLTMAQGPLTASFPPSPTSASFDAYGATGRFAISHGRLLASGTRPMYVEIRVRANDEQSRDGAETPAPVAMVLAIDSSGSMAGRKIEEARSAALSLLEEMRPDDMVSVVQFASHADIIVPLGRVGDIRSDARTKIRRIEAQGNTDIADALRTADRVLGSVHDGRVGRIVLVTDGRDTSGAPRRTAAEIAEGEASRGVTVSALGIGIDFDDAYLAGVSEAGRGNYEFLRDTSALARFLSKELREAAKTHVQNVRAHLSLPNGARVREVWGASWDGDHLSFGSLFVGDERRAIVSLDVATGELGSSFELGGVLSWRRVDGSPVEIAFSPLRVQAVSSPEEVDNARDTSVIASATSVISSQRETEAAMAFEKGDRDRALELNRVSRAELDKVGSSAPPAIAAQLQAQKRAYESHQGVFASSPPAAAAGAARDIGAGERKNTDRALSY